MIDQFLKQKVFGSQIRPQDIFLVPGNHDPEYAESLTEVRWTEYCRFYERHTDSVAAATGTPPPRFRPEHPEKLSRLINQADEGLIVAEVNSSAYVQKGTPDEVRGQIDGDVVPNLRKELAAIDNKLRAQAIKIALVHHHPVVLPLLAEAGRGYDGILSVGPLLNFLKDNHFILLMHGHKHNPCVFTYDPVNAWATDEIMPILLVAGGSAGAGSSALPPPNANTNTYNVIDLKWYPETKQARIHVETRGLIQTDVYGQPASPADWYWRTLRMRDRVLSPPLAIPEPTGTTRPKEPTVDGPFDALRAEILKSSRRNFPAIQILPSFNPQQNFEARVWIEAQKDSPEYEMPEKVEWSAAMNFGYVITCTGSSGVDFGARFTYHAPMLIQCRIFWRRLIPLSQVDQYLGLAGQIRNGAGFDFFGRS
jgi:hypothetical protein